MSEKPLTPTQGDWTDDEWVADQIRSHLLYFFDAVLEDNPEKVTEVINGFVSGRLRFVYDRNGMIIQEFGGQIAVPRLAQQPRKPQQQS